MIKVFATGDNHLGSTPKKKKHMREYVLNNFKLIYEKIKECEANYVFLAGDTFDIEVSMAPDVGTIFLSVISKIIKLKHVKKLFIISGNHDPLSSYYDCSLSEIVSSLKSEKIIHTDKEVIVFSDEKDKLDVTLLPFHKKYWFENEEKEFKIKETFDEICFEINKRPDNFHILCSHFAIYDWMPFGRYSLKLEDMPSKRFNTIILGDLHASGLEHWYNSNHLLFYTGATFHRSLDDLFQYECQAKYFEIKDGNIQNFKKINFPKPNFQRIDEYQKFDNPENTIILTSNLETFQQFSKDDYLHVELINKNADASDLKNILKSVFSEDSVIENTDENVKNFVKKLVEGDEKLAKFSLSLLDIDSNNLTKKELILKIKDMI